MLIEYTDFNNQNEDLSRKFASEWMEVEQTLCSMPLYVKGSNQQGIKGNMVFDPIATNAYIKNSLQSKGWIANAAIPEHINPLGKDVDFTKNTVLLEIQFSHYAFLLNNIIRSEVFFKSRSALNSHSVALMVLVTKFDILPSANSSLHYTQAVEQLLVIETANIFSLPTRIVGLNVDIENEIQAIFTQYQSPQSRRIESQTPINCMVQKSGKTFKIRAIG
ncbi:BglII/BstYI family type II restriction endonuclease [Spirulina subsalsa]|uniref:BglII/BstYI family type II restriction endonuclease n=1 Tax=Spirulina subsalsa TaxID=54311 RepID=UPI00035C29C1|nr:BglII/BstYI family type II restriction endonuclease [Spirulina subsalsa]